MNTAPARYPTAAGAARLQAPLGVATYHLSLGGSSTFLLNLARSFARRQFRLPIVVLSDEVDLLEDFSKTSAEIHALRDPRLILEDRLAWGYQQIAAYRPKAVLANLSCESFEVLRVTPRGAPRLGIIHSDDPLPYQLLPAFAPWLDAMIGVSAEICRKLKLMPESAKVRIEHIPYGIDFGDPLPRVKRNPAAPMRLIYVGRLVEVQKRVSRLVTLVRIIERRKINAHLTIVGTGPDEASVREGLEGCLLVTFRGAMPNHQIANLLREQDVFVLLSDFEGLPLSLLEAMAQGVVPVVSDLPSGFGEIVTPETGCRVPIGDAERAADAIEEFARNPSRLEQLSPKCATIAREHYNADLMADRLLALINQLSASGASPTWPSEVKVPPPRMERWPWLFQGFPRNARRFLKRISPIRKE